MLMMQTSTSSTSLMLSRLDAMLPHSNQQKDSIQRDSGNSSDFSSSGGGGGLGGEDDNVAAVAAAAAGTTGAQCVSELVQLEDERTLANLVFLEDYYRIHSNYFMFTQAEIKPWMHKTLACWMLEVCKNQSPQCYDEIFTLSMNLLDRFLAIQPIAKRHLQLLGTVCMFIAAKLKCSAHYSAETLVIYTANSITIDQLLAWEQLVMQRLRWDVQSVLAVDIIPHLLARMNISAQQQQQYEQLRNYISNFICACSTEFKFCVVPASMIAASCLYLALQRCQIGAGGGSSSTLEYIYGLVNTSMDFECLVQCVEQIDELICNEFKLNVASNEESRQISSSTTIEVVTSS